MAMFGLKKLGLEDPQGKDRKRIVTFVEIDRCATDAVMVVTGCRLGKLLSSFAIGARSPLLLLTWKPAKPSRGRPRIFQSAGQEHAPGN